MTVTIPLLTEPFHLRFLEALKKNSQTRPDQPCLIDFYTGQRTYPMRIYNAAYTIAGYLQNLEVKKNDIVVLVMDNGWEFIAISMAINLVGGIVSGAHSNSLKCKNTIAII